MDRIAADGGIPVFKLPLEEQKPLLDEDDIKEITEVLKSRQLGSPWELVVRRFEHEFASYCDSRHAIAVDHCASALFLALVCADIGRGDEVMMPAFSHISAAFAALYLDAKPVFVDIDPKSFNMNSGDALKKVTKRTKMILTVHMYGNPSGITKLKDIAEDYKITLVEDCAQALGARFNGHPVGSFGKFGCFSFDAKKMISTGEGGMLITDDERLAKKARTLRDNCRSETSPWPDIFPGKLYECIGYNFRMSEIQAALGISQLRKAEYLAEKYCSNGKLLAKILEAKKLEYVVLPFIDSLARHVFWRFVFRINHEELGLSGCQFAALLRAEGVPSYCFMGIPVHFQRIFVRQFRSIKKKENVTPQQFLPKSAYSLPIGLCPEAEMLARQEVGIELSPTLSKDDLDRIAYAIEKVMNACLQSKERILRLVKKLPP
jgi:perosamine synthetase